MQTMLTTLSTVELVQRLRAGDAQAAELLFQNYARQLSRLAEGHLSRQLAGRLDEDDIVQSVFRTFFRRCAEGEFHIDSKSGLWRLLVQITLRKVRAKARHHTAEKRDVAAETTDEQWLSESVTREPGPLEAVMLVDQIQHLLRGLPAQYGTVLELRLQAVPVEEIAARLKVSRQTVYRVLKLLQGRLERDAVT